MEDSEKYTGPRYGYGDKSPSILLGRSFQVLVSETSVFGVSQETRTDEQTAEAAERGSGGVVVMVEGSGIGFHRPDDKMQFFARNKTLQDSGDVTVILLD